MKGVTEGAGHQGRQDRYFNPHTREGCDRHRCSGSETAYNFNPHTREGCDGIDEHNPPADAISIHTPVKGVTASDCDHVVAVVISIHTPVKGVTLVRDSCKRVHEHFNPHTREGCDRLSPQTQYPGRHFNPHTREGCDADQRLEPPEVRRISIHTPVKGVTTVILFLNNYRTFQSTHP